MKQIDKLILKNFIGPYILSFFIAEFVLIMQFLWKWIDEILGKGFTMFEIMEMIAYFGMTIIPLALPISILLSSVMVFGEISEKYELASMKSAGISLTRVLRPALILAIGTFAFSIIASNYIKPAANFQYKKRWDLIKRQKTILNLEESTFNDDFRDFAIRFGSKDEVAKTINDVLIYDHTAPDRSLVNLMKSECGEMYTTPDGAYFVMNLYEGEQYQELDRKIENGKQSFPFIRTSFQKWSKVFDLSNFYLDENDVSINRNKEDMLNTFQLLKEIDTISIKIDKLKSENKQTISDFILAKTYDTQQYHEIIKLRPIESTKIKTQDSITNTNIQVDSLKSQLAKLKSQPTSIDNIMLVKKQEIELRQKIAKGESTNKFLKNKKVVVSKNTQIGDIKKKTINRKQEFNPNSAKHFYDSLDSLSYNTVVEKTTVNLESNVSRLNSTNINLDQINHQKQAYLLRLGQQYSFALVCILFLFIGAPMGSIIRKGGYGYPLLIAIFFYMLFMISAIVGEKLLKTDSVSGLIGAFLPCLILFPFTIYLTYLSLNDARFLWFEKIGRFISQLTKKKSVEVEVI